MPQKEYVHQPIHVRVSPCVVGQTVVNQLAQGWWFETKESDTQLVSADIHIRLIPYAVVSDGDGWGECLHGIGPFRTRDDYVLSCDNNTLICVPDDPSNASFGKILAIRGRQLQAGSESAQAEWDAVVNDPSLTWMPQLEFMSYVRDNLPQVVGRVLRYNIIQADRMGRFA